MFGLGMGELIVIGVIALIFIGPKKLPELAKGLGQGIKEFQKAAKGFSDQLQNADKPSTPEAEIKPQIADTAQQPEEGGHGPDAVKFEDLIKAENDKKPS